MNQGNLSHRGSTSSLSLLLVVAVMLWSFGALGIIRIAKADTSLTSVSDTITDSDVSVVASHTIAFTSAQSVDAAETIIVTFDPSGTAFDLTGVTASDVAVGGTGWTLVTSCDTGGDEVTVAVAAGADTLTFTVCSGDTVTSGAKTITLNGSNKITNPGSTGSYVIQIDYGSDTTNDEEGFARVFIVDDVTVTAAVDTTFTFTVTGIASGQTNANGEAGTTTITTTSTTIPWGTLAPDTAKTARQDLAVTTNAANGFTVTIWQDQDLTSGKSDTINKFRDGVDGAPQAWASPAATLGSADTYGHTGITSEDNTLSGGDTFGSALYDAFGTVSSPLEIFYHTGPADGTTDHQGDTKIGFKIEVDDLQEAGTDYTNTLTYIATPTF